MPTDKQKLGKMGEEYVSRMCACPSCKRPKTLRRLPANFKCADLICDFCGYLAQVKTKRTESLAVIPNRILGGAWGVQQDRMDSGIYFPIFLVLLNSKNRYAVHYLSADLQAPAIFVPRKPLSSSAKRSGWQGFYYDFSKIGSSFVKLI